MEGTKISTEMYTDKDEIDHEALQHLKKSKIRLTSITDS